MHPASRVPIPAATLAADSEIPASQPSGPLEAGASQRCWALVLSAGQGTRAVGPGQQPGVPKQYQLLAGEPLVLHTLRTFAQVPGLAGVVAAVSAGDAFLAPHAKSLGFRLAPCGGPERADTVLGGLCDLLAHGAQPQDWVLVHDGARCLLTPEQVRQLMQACAQDAVGGLLAQPLVDTLKVAAVDEAGVPRSAETLARAGKWQAQTPQMFRIGMLVEALEQAGARVTDEASAIEALGLQPRLVPSSALNFKVTYPDDFLLAEAVLARRQAAAAV